VRHKWSTPAAPHHGKTVVSKPCSISQLINND
jgi:hypothetical protein